MNNDINIIPVLLEEDKQHLKLDKTYKTSNTNRGEFFHATLNFLVNGVAKENYNVYSTLSNIDNTKTRSTLLLGGFKVFKDSFYNNSSGLKFESPVLKNMSDSFSIDIYVLETDKDNYKGDLKDGFFQQFTKEDLDLSFILKSGVKVASTYFHLAKEEI